MRLAVGVEIAGAGIKYLRKIAMVRGEGTTAGKQSCMTASGKPRPQRRSAPWPRPDTRTAPAIRAKSRTTPFIRQSVRVLAKPFALNREPSQSETTTRFRFGLGLGPDQRLSPAGPFPRGPDYGCGRGNLYSEAGSGPGLSWIGLRRQRSDARNHPGRAVPTEPA